MKDDRKDLLLRRVEQELRKKLSELDAAQEKAYSIEVEVRMLWRALMGANTVPTLKEVDDLFTEQKEAFA